MNMGIVSVCMLKNIVQFFESVHIVAHARTEFFTLNQYTHRTNGDREPLVDHVACQILPIASLIHRYTLGERAAIS